MPKIRANDIELAYQEHGDPQGDALLLVMGLAMPLTAWPPRLIDRLASRGFRVIVFDNRDIGRSQLFDRLPMPNVPWQIIKRKIGLKTDAPYQLHDMMCDAAGLLDALGVARAHVVGVSMGGMIAQLLALGMPERVRSLTSIMSTTGNDRLPSATRPVQRLMLKRPASTELEVRLAHSVRFWRLIGSPGYPVADDDRRAALLQNFERGMTFDGIARQMLAIIATPDRTPQLQNLEVPSLVIHGEADPLVPVECGRATAAAIPGSRLVTIPGMGHDLPDELLPRIDELIAEHMQNAGSAGETVA